MAMSFSNGQYITFPSYSELNITDNVTVSAWIYPTCLDYEWQMIFAKGINTEYNYYIMVNMDNFTTGYYSGGWQEAFGYDVFTLNTWYHVCGVFVTQGVNDTDMFGYINGTASFSNMCTWGNMLVNNHGAIMGSNDVNEHFYGYLDDVRVYNRALGASEIETIYACRGTDGIYNGLVGRWLLREKECGAIAASQLINVYNSQTGTPTNSPTYVPSTLKFRRTA